MGKHKSLKYAPCTVLVLVFLLCSCATAQSDFLSIDCGSSISYTDPNTTISWTSDATLVTEGAVRTVDGYPAPLNTFFSGNLSKYCYRLSNSAVKPGAFFIVRASFWLGPSPPFSPRNSEGYFQFKVLINADKWYDVRYESGRTSWVFREGYFRAQHNRINFCLARSGTGGDDPFISAIELRPLSSSLSVTQLMAATNLNVVADIHVDPGSNSASGLISSRYPADLLDRMWQSEPAPASDEVFSAKVTVNTSNDVNKPPVAVLQTALLPNTTWVHQHGDVHAMYFCVIYFAEIDGKVNASGQRVFNVLLNGERQLNAEPIDVYKEVGALASYELTAGNISTDPQGNISFTFSATNTSLYPPMFAAVELFDLSSHPFSPGSSSDDVMAIEDLKASMNLGSYTGDPCLPFGLGYSWATCFSDNSEIGPPKIQSISLSNQRTGGKIPKSINLLTMLDTILLDGNYLEGSIPNMSALTNLHTL